MKNFITAILLGFFAAPAFADTATFVACYGRNARMGLSFDKDQKGFTYQRADSVSQVDIEASPTTSLFEGASSVVIAPGSTFILKAHIVGGDVETPLFTHAEFKFQEDPVEGGYRLKKAVLVHHDVTYDLNEFVGIRCYIQ